jgi:molybdenum ABC transporter ATP-binding protein
MDSPAVLDVGIRYRVTRLGLDVALALGHETLAVVGPSGTGKTTVLRAIAGLVRPQEGFIRFGDEHWFDGARGVHLPPEQRRVGFVSQEGSLFPHMTVAANVAYGARRRGVSRRDARTRARKVLERFDIAHLAGARSSSLSGGERQRVALARAVASDPWVLLLDEPFAALDPATRARVGTELWTHLRDLGLPALLVSHDFEDVLGLANRISVMEEGRVVQTGTARELLESPASTYVASLTGVNYFSGTASRRGQVTEVRSSDAVFVSTDAADGAVGVVVYPWEVSLSTVEPQGSARNVLVGPVERVSGIGNRIRVVVRSSPSIVAEVTDGSLDRLGIAPGVRVVAMWKATGTRLIARASG